MDKKDIILKNLFAATTYTPFINKIIDLKNEDPALKDAYKMALSGLGGMYEFKDGGNLKKLESGELRYEINDDDPNFFKFGPERLEIQQFLNDKINEDEFIYRYLKLNEIHSQIFNNKPIKFGLVKVYILTRPLSLKSYFNISNEYKNIIDNCKNFVLLKRDGFNINIEYTYSRDKFSLRIDINDIINPKNIFDISHFEDIREYHEKVFHDDIDKIFGGLDG